MFFFFKSFHFDGNCEAHTCIVETRQQVNLKERERKMIGRCWIVVLIVMVVMFVQMSEGKKKKKKCKLPEGYGTIFKRARRP